MDIVFSETNQTGIIKLNRPKALNALNLEMAKKFHDKLLEWEEKDKILRVLLVGEGKHFCAGGDVKSLVLAGKENSLKHDFFKIEYKLNYLISQFSKEFLSVWNGVVMGGGVGLSIYGDHRLATDNSKFAMPESAIGFFPDVGGSYFLSNLPGNIGKYIGLTGEVLGLNELIFFGLATHYFKSNKIEDVVYWYKAKYPIKKFKVGGKKLWKWSKKNYNKRHESEEKNEKFGIKKKNTITIKKVK